MPAAIAKTLNGGRLTRPKRFTYEIKIYGTTLGCTIRECKNNSFVQETMRVEPEFPHLSPESNLISVPLNDLVFGSGANIKQKGPLIYQQRLLNMRCLLL